MATVKDALPDGLVRRFHLVSLPFSWALSEDKEYVQALGREFLKSRVEKFYTSHCTGSKGYRILDDIMGEGLEYFPAGSKVRI